MTPRPGEIWLANLGVAAKTRPVVVALRFDADAPRALINLCSFDHAEQRELLRDPLPKLSFLNSASVANVQGIRSIPTVRLERRIGKLPENTLAEIRKALSFALDLAGLSQ